MVANTAVPNKEDPAGTQFPENACAGNAIDVTQLFLQHRRHLIQFVQRYVRNREDAEDIVQNTFIEAIRCADRFSGLSKPSTWLFGIALNLSRNHVRRKFQTSLEVVDDAAMLELAAPNSDPEEQAHLRELALKIEALLSHLPRKIRETFEAVLDGESTYEEAAEQLHIPVGTLRSRVSRVRANVRSEFGHIDTSLSTTSCRVSGKSRSGK